jgi:hypothetical protein
MGRNSASSAETISEYESHVQHSLHSLSCAIPSPKKIGAKLDFGD